MKGSKTRRARSPSGLRIAAHCLRYGAGVSRNVCGNASATVLWTWLPVVPSIIVRPPFFGNFAAPGLVTAPSTFTCRAAWRGAASSAFPGVIAPTRIAASEANNEIVRMGHLANVEATEIGAATKAAGLQPRGPVLE
jgi:hypothetical protein